MFAGGIENAYAIITAPAASIIASIQKPADRSAASPSCRAVPEGYSWKMGDDEYEVDNIAIPNFGNPSFQVISALWLRDKFEKAEEIDTSMLSRWVIADPTTGPATLDNVCYTHEFAFWGNWFPSATFTTPEGHPVQVDYHDDEQDLGIQDQQKLILQGLVESNVSIWNPQMHNYIGEFESLASAILLYSGNENVTAYADAVKDGISNIGPFSFPDSNDIGFFMSYNKITRYIYGETIPATKISSFFDATAPLSLTKEQIAGIHTDSENKEGALDKLGVHDQEMATILKASWYIRKAYEIASKEELTEEDAVKAQGYADKAQELIDSITTPIPDALLKSTDADLIRIQSYLIMTAEIASKGKELTAEDANKLQEYAEKVQVIMDSMTERQADLLYQSISRIEDAERQHMALWILLKIQSFGIGGPQQVSQQDCLYKSKPEEGTYYVLNADGTDCRECDEGTQTTDGLNCVQLLSAEKCYADYPRPNKPANHPWHTHVYNVEKNKCDPCPEGQYTKTGEAGSCQNISQGGGSSSTPQQPQQQPTQTSSVTPIVRPAFD